MENNIWRGFTKEEQELCHRMKERDSQVENYLSGTIQAGYEIVLERMESSLAIICKLLKEGKVEDARKLYETIFSYYSEDADLWLVTTYGRRLTAKDFLDIYEHNDKFAAYVNHGVYYVDSSQAGIFEETPFHPDLLLKEYVKLFHPELLPGYQLKYYRQMEY